MRRCNGFLPWRRRLARMARRMSRLLNWWKMSHPSVFSCGAVPALETQVVELVEDEPSIRFQLRSSARTGDAGVAYGASALSACGNDQDGNNPKAGEAVERGALDVVLSMEEDFQGETMSTASGDVTLKEVALDMGNLERADFPSSPENSTVHSQLPANNAQPPLHMEMPIFEVPQSDRSSEFSECGRTTVIGEVVDREEGETEEVCVDLERIMMLATCCEARSVGTVIGTGETREAETHEEGGRRPRIIRASL
mmetsp:Transcript_24684/g.57333  ORF Transcript_24684/g.57333 Transcript_24684/m.57333 type:complete len:254 (-) Transcript_24684:170-931(-)